MEAVLEKPQLKKKKKPKVLPESSKTEEVQEGSSKLNEDNLSTCTEVLEDPVGENIESKEVVVEEKVPIEKDAERHEQKTFETNCNKEQANVEVKISRDLTQTNMETKLTSEFEKLLNLNKEIIKTIKIEDVKTIKMNPVKLKDKTLENEQTTANFIKPYTEQQLSALYHNSELETLEHFVVQYVEAELKGLAIKQHPLYDLLMNYLKIKERITGNTLELEQIRKEYKNLQSELWTMEPATVNGRAECQDGQVVTASHTYNKSVFHRSVFQTFIRILGNVQKLTYENHVLFSFTAEDLRLQIELFLQSVITNCITVTQLDKNAPVALTLQSEPPHLKPYIGEVRLCISILFAFQRKLIRDSQFLKETRNWLRQLVAVLLRLANYQDHLFIISHILRCPAGVGSWGSCFVQLPLGQASQESPFTNYQLNHVLTILAAILSPIKERDKFLEDIAQNSETATEALWVIVDSDGEDDENSGTSLRENDLVALLNQLPLDDLFRSILLISTKDYNDIYDVSVISENHLLRFLAFGTVLLKLLHRGLQIYNQSRYNQFSKRLSRFIRHVAQYATDQWEAFLKAQILEDQAMRQRLQTEYDAFFLRAIYYLYSSQKLGAWQFLAVIPYNMVTLKTLWKIFYFLHNCDNQAKDILNPLDTEDYSKKLWNDELRTQFEEKLSNLEDAEIYYLLNTFANMAMARESTDMDFIWAATMDLLQVGFISQTTQEGCSKSAKILLTHITSKYPHLLSNILKVVKDNIKQIDTFALYLYEELPLAIWNVTETDLELISRLLLSHSITATETKLARMILSRLNWDTVPYEIQCHVAILVVKAADQELGYSQWAWQTILRLKLHISDKHFKEIGRVQEVETYDVLTKGIRDSMPLASFVTVLMTTWGHLVPLIGSRGLPQLLFLQVHQKHEAVLFALYQIVPVFINSQECLINCNKFQEILVNLLNADRGYISMAKSFISTQNTVLQQFGNMIETQIVNFAYYDLESPRCLVRLWMNSLVSIPNWNKDNGIIYLLDVITRTAFFHKDALEVVYSILSDLYQCGTPTEHSGAISNFFKWVSSSNSNSSLISNSLSSYPWLAYIFIEIEHQEREVRTGLWKGILIQLAKQKGKISVDNAIKKAADTVKVSSFTSGFLCIYRWAQQALDTPVDHPLLPLLWQKFFTLFLARLPATSAADRSCVGDKFFDGLVNFAFFKRIKRRLQDTVEHYHKKIDIKDTEISKKQFYQSCHKVFQALLLWLEESRIQENNVLLNNLPTQYEHNLLSLIFQENNTPWFQYLDYEKLKQEQLHCIRTWRVANFREKTNVNRPLLNPGSSVENPDPVKRILRRLTSYDAPKQPPDITISAPVIPKIDFTGKEAMFKSFEQCFKTLKQFAHNHHLKLSEHKSLDCSYQELIPQLYRSVLNKVKKKVPCRGKGTVLCSGVAVIVLEMQEARINERIDHQIQVNRNTYESLLTQCLQPPATSLCTASVTIQQSIRILQSQIRCNPATAELGVELFYYILSLLNEETLAYLPTKTLFTSCLEKLGQSHICGVETEMPGLLQKILNEPNLGAYLAPHFSPTNVGTSSLLLMYSTVTKEIGQKYDIAFALSSKFEIDSWLKNRQPKLSQRSQFIQSVIIALTSIGFDPPVEALMLHGLYRKHLLTVFEFQFPEHFGEVLMHLLKASNGSPDSNLLAVSVWMDIFNSLSKPVSLQLNAPLRDQLRQYAQHQKMLQHQELLETAELLSRHFTQERLQYGLYGLYPKCRNYMDVFALLLGLAGHGLIVSTLNTHQGLLGDKLVEKIWPYLRDMFAPWLVPYSMQNLKENMASWIQQLADDRSILLPWIPADSGHAQIIVHVFFECVMFVMHTLPASKSILSYLWQWYVTSFAHTSVKDHILVPVHQTFLCFPWQNFWPSIIDLEFMLRVVDQYLPDCHAFLGHIFVSVPWSNWLNNFANSPSPMKTRVYQCFLNLVVKLSNEPSVRKNYAEKAKALLVQAENFDWTALDPIVYQHVMDWFVMSGNPGVIFKRDPLDLDYRVLHLLKTVSGYNKPLCTRTPSADVINKRLIFIKTTIKLLSVYTSRHKNSIPSKTNEIYGVISRYLNDLENVVKIDEEMDILLKELIGVLNISNISDTALKALIKWTENKPGDGLIVKSLLKTLGMSVNDHEILADLYEAVLNSYFANIVSQDFEPTWKEVAKVINILVSKQTELEQVLLNRGSILTLNAILVQRMSKYGDTEALLNLCIDWMMNIKISKETESKVPLIWLGILKLSLENCDKDEASTGAILYKFSQILLQISEDKGSSGWGRGLLSAIGISKQEGLSLHFRFICRALGGYILAQLPDMKGELQVVRRVENAPSKVGQPGGNTECVKILLALDFGQSQGKIKECAELALKQIQDPNNSLHNAGKFLLLLFKQFYIKPYLKDIG